MIELSRRCMLACQQNVEPSDLRVLLRKHGPLYGTFKIDGIRMRIHAEKNVEMPSGITKIGMSRRWKPIPNNMVQDWVDEYKHLHHGMDGEIVVPGVGFNQTQSYVMREVSVPFNWVYYIFDYYIPEQRKGYLQRLQTLKLIYKWNPKTYFLEPRKLSKVQEVKDYEKEAFDLGFEGLILRTPQSPYKLGRATWDEGFMFKMKRFTDGEAIALGFEPKQVNDNEKTIDELGYTKRSKHSAGKRAVDTLGRIQVRDIESGAFFNIGSGWDQELAQEIWDHRSDYLGEILTYTKAAYGEKDKPRQPIFKGFRQD